MEEFDVWRKNEERGWEEREEKGVEKGREGEGGEKGRGVKGEREEGKWRGERGDRREEEGGVAGERSPCHNLPLAARWNKVSEHRDRTFIAKLRIILTPLSGKPRPSREFTHSLAARKVIPM